MTAADATDREQSPQLFSRALDGGLPNGASTDAVISGDRRWAGVIAFTSDASNLVSGDANGSSDVFALAPRGLLRNDGSPWNPGSTTLVSRGLGGAPANGPSFPPSVDGSFTTRASCVGFLSAAYLFTDVRNTTLLESVQDKGVALPSGSQRPSISPYANYLLFDTPGPLGSAGPGRSSCSTSAPSSVSAVPSRRWPVKEAIVAPRSFDRPSVGEREPGLRRAVRGASVRDPARPETTEGSTSDGHQHRRAGHHPRRDPDRGAHADDLGHPD